MKLFEELREGVFCEIFEEEDGSKGMSDEGSSFVVKIREKFFKPDFSSFIACVF